MPRFHYQVLNAQGVSLEGMLRADSERDAARQLERRGLSVVEIRSGESTGRTQRGRLRHADVILALQELATMLTSGVSIADAVGSQAALAQHLDTVWRDALGFAGIEIHRRILGLAHVAEFEAIADLGLRAALERTALAFGRHLAVNRRDMDTVEAGNRIARGMEGR